MKTRTIYEENGEFRLIDQTLLPTEFKELTIGTPQEMFEAIQSLRVRGAPAIGIAAAMGAYLGVKDSQAQTASDFYGELRETTGYLATSRPTAVNLFWALERVDRLVGESKHLSVSELKALLVSEVRNMIEEDNRVCRAIGEHGAALLSEGDTILTHCNAGGLATALYGTALAPVYMAKEQGKAVKVFADETRPLLQGARLTTWELMQNGIEVTLICDNMAPSVMAKGWIDHVIVGTDRVAANGDFANKIGTYGVALAAARHNVPFYVAAPFSSIDFQLKSGSEIPIEERKPEEITHGFGRQTAPTQVKVYNPAFDVTPREYVTGFITEKGVLQPPFQS